VVPVAHIWYFRSLPNKIGYLLGIPTKKLDAVIYYERYIVIQPGVMAKNKDIPVQKLDLLSEEEYEAIMDRLPQGNEYLEDKDPNKFSDAVMYDELTHSEVLAKGLAVMDASAASMCRDNGIKILVFNLSDPENIVKAVRGEKVGTLVK
jgi:DNA-directed RNA polymerase beta' subunit